MPNRLAGAICAAILILITPADAIGAIPRPGAMTFPGPGPTPSPPGSATPSGPSSSGSPTPGPSTSGSTLGSRHRLFFANAQRESLTGTASARRRMRLMVKALHRSRADVGVLVELDGSQPRFFRNRTRGSWELISAGHGVRNAVIYDSSVWTLVSRKTIPTYWKGGRRTRTPVVILRTESGEQVGVIGVHNPRDDSRLRRVNNRRILAAVRRLQRDGIGVLTAGDFNTGRAALCLYTGRRHQMASAGHRRRHACRDHRSARIDQAFATPDVQLRGYRRSASRATDHGAVYSIGFRLRHRRTSA